MRLAVIYLICFLCVDVYAIDRVDIIAPSCKGMESNLTRIREYVKTLDLDAHIAKKIYSNDNPFYSNSDEFRANDLINALTDNSKIIWCIKGGKGASRLIPYLEKLPDEQKEKIAQNKNKKILIGYSDITPLHIYLQIKYDWQTLHGTMLEMIVNALVSQDSIDKLQALILGKQDSIRFDNLKIINELNHGDGDIKSTITGGNMTLIENGIGTVWQINVKDKILFLEDIGVSPYAMERSLDHLKQANIFDGVCAVIFGDFINSGDDDLVAVVKKRFAQSVNFPVFTMHGVGHGFVNDPLPFNTSAVISIQDEKKGLFFMDVQNINCSPSHLN